MPDGTPANQNETPENRSNRNDYANKLYESLSREIRELERNFISLLVPLISALSVYGIGLKAYLQQPCEQNLIFFTITTGAFILLLIIVWFASNIFAYTHRSNQVILSRIEDKAGLYGKKKDKDKDDKDNIILPPDWNLNDKLKKCNSTDPPEIYKFFKLVSFITGLLGIGIYCVLIRIKISLIVENINFCLGIVGVTLVLIFVFAYKFRWCSWKNPFKCECYSKKLKDIANNGEKRLCQ